MSRRTISISVPAEIEEKLKRAAEQSGKPLEEWFSEALQAKARELEKLEREKADEEARHAAAVRAAEELVAETEALYGPIPEEVWREAEELVTYLLTATPTTLTEVVEP